MKLTAKQHDTIVESFRKNPDTMSFTAAFKRAGLRLVKAQIDAQLAEDGLLEEINEARGRNIEAVERTRWEVALDKDHRAWEPANRSLLKAYKREFADKAEVDITSGGEPIKTKDESASLASVLAMLKAVGADDPEDGGGTPSGQVPSPGEVLPDPPDR